MLAASAQVIHHRTNRRNNAAQLFEMGNEKVQAAIESSHAMTRHWLTMHGRTGPALLEQWVGLLASGLTPFHARAVRNARRASRR
jgi:N-acetylmuramic acid 6-phosphate (MurNAc-6-P) etherase